MLKSCLNKNNNVRTLLFAAVPREPDRQGLLLTVPGCLEPVIGLVDTGASHTARSFDLPCLLTPFEWFWPYHTLFQFFFH